jgi:hypothetical protein
MSAFTVFDYYYRDASNYKAWGSLLLEGSAVEADTKQVSAALNDYDFFIAEQLGIPPVYDELWAFSDGPTEDDHVWHTFDCFREPREDEMSLPVWGTVSELVARFAAVKKWNEALSPHWDSWI